MIVIGAIRVLEVKDILEIVVEVHQIIVIMNALMVYAVLRVIQIRIVRMHAIRHVVTLVHAIQIHVLVHIHVRMKYVMIW